MAAKKIKSNIIKEGTDPKCRLVYLIADENKKEFQVTKPEADFASTFFSSKKEAIKCFDEQIDNMD
jgi:hypothetical protein